MVSYWIGTVVRNKNGKQGRIIGDLIAKSGKLLTVRFDDRKTHTITLRIVGEDSFDEKRTQFKTNDGVWITISDNV